MSRKCEITGKKPVKACSLSTRGIAKKHKGIGINILKRSKRRQLPNMIQKKIWCTTTHRFIKMKISVHALRKIDAKGISKVLKTAKN